MPLHALEPGVLRLEFTQLRHVRDRHTAELALLFAVGRLADALLPARLTNLGAKFDFSQEASNLACIELRFLQVATPFRGILYCRVAQDFKGASGRLAQRRICFTSIFLPSLKIRNLKLERSHESHLGRSLAVRKSHQRTRTHLCDRGKSSAQF